MHVTAPESTFPYEQILTETVSLTARMDVHVILVVVMLTYLIKIGVPRFQQSSSESFIWCPILLSTLVTPFISQSFEVQQQWEWFFYFRAVILNGTGSAVGFAILLPRLQRWKPGLFGETTKKNGGGSDAAA